MKSLNVGNNFIKLLLFIYHLKKIVFITGPKCLRGAHATTYFQKCHPTCKEHIALKKYEYTTLSFLHLISDSINVIFTLYYVLYIYYTYCIMEKQKDRMITYCI